MPRRKHLEPTKYPREKMFGHRKYPREKIRTNEGTMARWHETHENHKGMKPTEISTLDRYMHEA